MGELEEVIDLLEPDIELLKKGRERQSAIWKKKESDYLPILLIDSEVPELCNLKHWTLKEQFFDREKMLIEQLKGLVGIAKTKSDAQLSIRANLGVGVVPSIFGLKPIFPQDDQMPWYEGNLTKEEISRLEPPTNVRNMGVIPQAIEYAECFKKRLKKDVHIYCFDTQGPFDIAHLIRGPQIYTDLYDDPEFAHHLMEISTHTYIEATKVFKNISGEPLSNGYHGALYMGSGGVRLCEDSSTNLSPKLFREFSFPYIKKALSPFEGGWVHFCGNANHLLDMYLEIDEIKGINFGNPEKYDYEKTISKIISKGKFYYGTWPRKKDEDLRQYFRRLLAPLGGKKQGLILQLARGKNMPSSGEIIELWHSVQEGR